MRAAWLTASSPDAQSRFTVTAGTWSGNPASRLAIRATFRLSSPAWFAHPSTTIVEVARVHTRPVHDRPQHEGREIVRTNLGEPTLKPTDGGAQRLDDHDLVHGDLRRPL